VQQLHQAIGGITYILGGNSTSGTGGYVRIAGGAGSPTTDAGYVQIDAAQGGSSTSNYGFIQFRTGTNTLVEAMRILKTGAISFGSTGSGYGSAGQVLTSQGNATPTWTSVGTVTSVNASGGTGISVTGGPITSSGSLTITNTGVTSLAGTTNQVIASASTGAVTLSLPTEHQRNRNTNI